LDVARGAPTLIDDQPGLFYNALSGALFDGRFTRGTLMHSLDSLTTIIFALVAIAVIWKLRSVLGERTGTERPPRDIERPPHNIFGGRREPGGNAERGGSNVVRMPLTTAATRTAGVTPVDRWRGYAEAGSSVARGLDAIAAADAGFSAAAFVDGAKIAYETIIIAFAKGDRDLLSQLLAPDVYSGFVSALEDRVKRGETVTTTIVSLDAATIEDAAMQGRTARVTMRFRSKLITATHDGEGKLVDGSPDKPVDMNDLWSFARETRSRDPNWKLVATESGH
jgi:predicted lipid-binding transport protein (Tim44 family)